MAHLSLAFLGTFQAMLAGKPLAHFRSARVQGLLVYLALTRPSVRIYFGERTHG